MITYVFIWLVSCGDRHIPKITVFSSYQACVQESNFSRNRLKIQCPNKLVNACLERSVMTSLKEAK